MTIWDAVAASRVGNKVFIKAKMDRHHYKFDLSRGESLSPTRQKIYTSPQSSNLYVFGHWWEIPEFYYKCSNAELENVVDSMKMNK